MFGTLKQQFMTITVINEVSSFLPRCM